MEKDRESLTETFFLRAKRQVTEKKNLKKKHKKKRKEKLGEIGRKSNGIQIHPCRLMN